MGCTAAVTLTAAHETSVVESLTKKLDLMWLHAPIAPISNARKGISDNDMESFREVHKAFQWLEEGQRVVVHCQAGCHRTGIFCYVLLRHTGCSSEELIMACNKRPEGLVPKAEGIFQRLRAS